MWVASVVLALNPLLPLPSVVHIWNVLQQEFWDPCVAEAA